MNANDQDQTESSQSISAPASGEVPGHGLPDWPEWCKTFNERKAYQQGVADARVVEKLSDESTLTPLQQFVLKNYSNGDFAHLQTIDETVKAKCGDTLVQFLIAEAQDADGDTQQLAQQISSAIRELQDLHYELMLHRSTETQRG